MQLIFVQLKDHEKRKQPVGPITAALNSDDDDDDNNDNNDCNDNRNGNDDIYDDHNNSDEYDMSLVSASKN